MRTLICALLSVLLAACETGAGGGTEPTVAVTPPRTGAPGHVDTAFAQGGLFVFPSADLPDSYTQADSAARLESGKILLSGAYTGSRVDPFSLRTGLLVRLLPNGALDRSFLGTGYLQFTGSLIESVVSTRLIPLPGDRAIWAHFTARLCGGLQCPPPDPETHHLYARRMNAAGSVENTYGTFGTAVGHLRPIDIAAAPDGAMTVFGERILPYGSPHLSVLEAITYDRDGAPVQGAGLPDPPAGSCPSSDTDSPRIRAARQPDGKSLAMWVQTRLAGSEICLVRLDASGAPDTSFGYGGFAALQGIPGADIPVVILARRDGGSIGVFTATLAGNAYAPILVWFDAGGNLDTSRGNGGVSRSLASGIAVAQAAVLQPDEKILIAGTPDAAASSATLPAGIARIARLDAAGNLDRTFGPAKEGMVSLAVAGRAMLPAHLMVAADWAIFVSGSTGAPCSISQAVCDPASMAMMKLVGGER